MDKYSEIWAKKPLEGQSAGESLVAHTLRVWATFESLYKRWPLPKAGSMLRIWSQAALAVVLHDFGKCASGFQKMLRGGNRFPYRHEVISAGLVPYILPADNSENHIQDLPWVVAGVLSHHKDISHIMQNYPEPGLFYPPLPDNLETVVRELDQDFFANVPGIWQEIIEVLKENPVFQQMVNDLSPQPIPTNLDQTSFARNMRQAITAYEELVVRITREPFNSEMVLAGRFLRGMVIMSDHAGSAKQQFRNLTTLNSVPEAVEALGVTLNSKDSIYRHQSEAANTSGSTLLIAPTGSGKTEAALLWAVANASHEGSSPVFYVLPYQASLNAMRFRLGHVLGNENVVLQHSRTLSALYRFLLDRDYDRISAKKMAKQEINLGKLHLAPIRVLTPYQLLRGPFQLKGHEALLTDTVGGRFIVDEVHAYEPRRLGMILATLAHLVLDLEAKALVMSATMPTVCQQFFTDRLRLGNPITASPEAYWAFRRHRLRLWDHDLLSEKIIEEICGQAISGKKVLVVATTVARAQEVRKRIIEHIKLKGRTVDTLPVELLHGKFCARDRFSKERDLLGKVATKGATQLTEGFVLVATQVVEVSLDIDFDVLYSDPAPLEALFQRFGRINRGRRHPECWVNVMLKIPDQSPVYNEMIVHRALEKLLPLNGEMIDESQLQEVLDSAYEGPISTWWQKEVKKAYDDFSSRILSSLYPFQSADLEERFYEMFDGAEVLPLDLFGDYQAAMEDEPLEAAELMVPVTQRQFWQLKKDMIPLDEPGLYVVRRPYSKEYGLVLEREILNEGV